ncbi:MAG TPA: hypothetical protein VHL57_01455, partial [Flavobacteriales bacterium]|nr:hypothetical protein [Flavobacteriales bacterium]
WTPGAVGKRGGPQRESRAGPGRHGVRPVPGAPGRAGGLDLDGKIPYALMATLPKTFRLNVTINRNSIMQRTSTVDRSQLILTSGIISAVLSVALFVLAYLP